VSPFLPSQQSPLLAGFFVAGVFAPASHSPARYNPKAIYSKIHALMKTSLPQLLLCAACAMFATVASADKEDRNKPINIEADALRYDDLKQTSIFTGRVIVTKGSIVIRGAQVEVHQDPEGYQFAVVTAEPGKLAYFRQKRDGVDEFIEGESEVIEYDGRTDLVKLIRNAQFRRLRGSTMTDEVTGAEIRYNNVTELFTVDGSAATVTGGSKGRVKAMLTPKSDPPAGAASAADPGIRLRPTNTLGKERK
jgi:lipopolysaccharide export system protein LptA